jgi:hypothetical protein
MYIVKDYVYIIPPLQLLHAFVLSFIEVDQYKWVVIGNSDGFSVATGLVYVSFFCYTKRFCLFTRIASWSVFSISVFNLISALVLSSYKYPIYEAWYARIATGIAVALWVIYFNSKSQKKQ